MKVTNRRSDLGTGAVLGAEISELCWWEWSICPEQLEQLHCTVVRS